MEAQQTIISEIEQIYQRQRADQQRLDALMHQAPDGIERHAVVEVRRGAIAATNKTGLILQRMRQRVR